MLGGIALAVAIIVILIYVMIRFEVFSGLSAVIALIHDVAIMFCITIIFKIQVNAAFVSAIITIVAYSINNTIVIFDRVREFGVPVIAGLIGGFYSSMFLSPSLYILMKESNEKRKAKTAAKKALAAKEAKAAAAK